MRSMLHFMCVHPIDLAIALFGEPLSVDSRLAGTSRGALHLALTLRCSEDRLVQLTLDSAQPRIQERLEVSGLLDDGAALLCVDNVQYLEVHRQGRNGIDVVSFEEKMVRNLENWEIEPVFDLADIQVWRPDYAVPNVGQHRLFFQGYIGELREFANAIREHRSARPANRACLGAMRVAAAVLARPEGTTELIRNEQL